MPAFTEQFNSVSAWTFNPGGGSPDLSASAVEFFTSPTSGRFVWQDGSQGMAYRLDNVDGGDPTATCWTAFAFFLPTWADLWAGDQYVLLPMIPFASPPLFPNNGYGPFLTATSPTTGRCDGSSGTGPAVSAGVWNTARYGVRLDGVNSTEELWVNNALVFSNAFPTFNPVISTGGYGMLFGNDASVSQSSPAVFYVDAATWNPTVDPGEPIPTPPGPPPTPGECTIGVVIDGQDVSGVAIEGSVTRRLNRISQAQIKIPMDLAPGGPGSKLKVYFDSTLFFHGTVLDCETDGGEDDGYTVYNASDPMELWQWRLVRDADGDFSKPDIIETYDTGPQIMEAALHHSIGDGDSTGSGPPITAEGPIFLDFGTIEGGGVSLKGAPTDWPMTIAQLSSLLMSTGELDAVIDPTDPGGGVMGTVSFYNGDFGTDLSGSVDFQYGLGSLNVRAMRWNEDMTGLINKLQYYLGPRVGTSDDPAGDQHWRANVQSFDPDFSGALEPPGGKSVDATNTPIGPPWTNNQLGEQIYNSRQQFGVRMDVRIYDARGDEATVGRLLYKRLWQIESWLRSIPRNLVHITPIRGYPLGMFDIGDLVGVEAASFIRGGFSGAQRVYGYTVSWGEDGPCELSELQTSSDQEGF